MSLYIIDIAYIVIYNIQYSLYYQLVNNIFDNNIFDYTFYDFPNTSSKNQNQNYTQINKKYISTANPPSYIISIRFKYFLITK